MGEMFKFYQSLYASKNIDNKIIDDYLSEINVPVISEDNKRMLDKFPTIEECTEAVNSMKHHKSPGLDGLPSEFYKCFWNVIGPYFYDALKDIYENKMMTYTQRQSVISLVFKKGEKNSLKNYRPISLTNTDYKIIAFVFAKRLQKILKDIINDNQTAYIKGRYIGENNRLILDIFEFCESENVGGILLFLDFEKAFDSVEWNFLFKTLKKFNIGKFFITWANILYTNPIFKMKNNGWLSKSCSMTRGIRQG